MEEVNKEDISHVICGTYDVRSDFRGSVMVHCAECETQLSLSPASQKMKEEGIEPIPICFECAIKFAKEKGETLVPTVTEETKAEILKYMSEEEFERLRIRFNMLLESKQGEQNT